MPEWSYILEFVCGVVFALAAWGLIRWSWRARVVPRTLFFAGAISGVLAIGLLSAVVFPIPPFPIVAQFVYVMYLIQRVSLSRLAWLRSIGAACSRGIPLEAVLVASRGAINPFDRQRLRAALVALEAGAGTSEVLACLKFPGALRLVLGLQTFVPGSISDEDVRRAWQREQRVIAACQRRGGHWLYLGLTASVGALTTVLWDLGWKDTLAEFELTQLAGRGLLSGALSHYVTWIYWVLVLVAQWGVLIGGLRYATVWPFAPWRTPRAVQVMRLLPGLKAAVEQRVSIADYRRHFGTMRLPRSLEKLLELVERAEREGRSWIDVLFRDRGFAGRQRDLLHQAESLGNLPWAIDIIAERIARRLEARQHLVNSIVFPAFILVIAGATGIVPITMFLQLANVVQAIR